MQSKEGYFLRFDISEISEVKKTALGVHGMKMGDNDYIEQVFYTYAGQNTKIEYKGKQIDMNKLKVSKKGCKRNKN